MSPRRSRDPELDAASIERLGEETRSFLRRTLTSGLDILSQTEGGIKQITPNLGLPKEVVRQIISMLEKIRGDLAAAMGKEFGAFLDRININEEAMKLLTGLALEVKAEVRFKRVDDEAVAPVVKQSIKVKDKHSASAPRRGREQNHDAGDSSASDPEGN